MRLKKISLLILGIVLSFDAFAQIKVAVAANLQSVIKVLGADFKSQSGIVIEPIVGASGNLVAQIKNGAPFDVFLSADMSFPQALYREGFTVDKPVVYAFGSLIICSTEETDVKHWQKLIIRDDVKKIAIANTTTAPYGKAAMEALTKTGLIQKVTPKLVTGESITQVNTYIFNNVVPVGFTSQSFIYESGQSKKLFWQLIDPKLYTPIEQGLVILKHAKDSNYEQAQKFYKYLLSSSAKAILKKYGYHVAQ